MSGTVSPLSIAAKRSFSEVERAPNSFGGEEASAAGADPEVDSRLGDDLGVKRACPLPPPSLSRSPQRVDAMSEMAASAAAPPAQDWQPVPAGRAASLADSSSPMLLSTLSPSSVKSPIATSSMFSESRKAPDAPLANASSSTWASASDTVIKPIEVVSADASARAGVAQRIQPPSSTAFSGSVAHAASTLQPGAGVPSGGAAVRGPSPAHRPAQSTESSMMPPQHNRASKRSSSSSSHMTSASILGSNMSASSTASFAFPDERGRSQHSSYPFRISPSSGIAPVIASLVLPSRSSLPGSKYAPPSSLPSSSSSSFSSSFSFSPTAASSMSSSAANPTSASNSAAAPSGKASGARSHAIDSSLMHHDARSSFISSSSSSSSASPADVSPHGMDEAATSASAATVSSAPPSTILNAPLISCSQCDFRCSFQYQFDWHIAECHTGPNAAQVGNVYFKAGTVSANSESKQQASPANATDDIGSNAQIHVCGQAGCEFRSAWASALVKHTRELHKPGAEARFGCSLCSFRCVQRRGLAQHMRAEHEDADGQYACDVCKITFTTISNLHKHQRAVHEKERPYACYLCPYRSAQSSNLSEHLRCVHFGERAFACNLCSHRSSRAASLMSHLRDVHGVIRPVSSSAGPGKATRARGASTTGNGNVTVATMPFSSSSSPPTSTLASMSATTLVAIDHTMMTASAVGPQHLQQYQHQHQQQQNAFQSTGTQNRSSEFSPLVSGALSTSGLSALRSGSNSASSVSSSHAALSSVGGGTASQGIGSVASTDFGSSSSSSSISSHSAPNHNLELLELHQQGQMMQMRQQMNARHEREVQQMQNRMMQQFQQQQADMQQQQQVTGAPVQLLPPPPPLLPHMSQSASSVSFSARRNTLEPESSLPANGASHV